MIVCPNCNHQNPDGAVQCEACYTPLPALESCPSCGASVQSDASFCGQCGASLKTAAPAAVPPQEEETFVPMEETISSQPAIDIPDLIPPDPLVTKAAIAQPEVEESASNTAMPSPLATEEPPPPLAAPSVPEPASSSAAAVSAGWGGATRIQSQQAKLLHVQTDTTLELPPQLPLIHIGKPNDRVPPNIDVSGFPSSEIVSRVHADIRVEGDIYYIEDVGSSNGTYINNMPLAPGNRHRLRPGDKVALGKGDKVTFIFQLG